MAQEPDPTPTNGTGQGRSESAGEPCEECRSAPRNPVAAYPLCNACLEKHFDSLLPARARPTAPPSIFPSDNPETRAVQRARFAARQTAPQPSMLVREFDEIPPAIIEPFVRYGDFVIVTGLAGHGKSNLAADLLAAMLLPLDRAAAGSVWAGAIRVDVAAQGVTRCAIIDADEEPVDWSRKLSACTGLRSVDWAGPVADEMRTRCLHFNAYDLNLHDRLRWTEVAIEAAWTLDYYGVQLVFIDPLAATFCPRSSSDEDWVSLAIRPFRYACRKLGITVVCIAHTARPSKNQANGAIGMPIGTSGQEAAVDWLLHAHRFPGGVKLKTLKHRRAWWVPLDSVTKLYWGPRGSGYVRAESAWAFEPPAEPLPELADASHALIRALGRARLPLPQAVLCERTDISQSTASKSLNALLVFEMIEVASGTGRAGDPKLFRLTEKGRTAAQPNRRRTADAPTEK